ncbi:hypothetical protein BU16DRAFT_620278 [Lophium mytilinum]|uniref:DUF6594 domain-containing protein n=1 Tax=Lophium mytilinum TaxID=390894 RepID=A0A6A6QKX8_9PEZI|nr:hypothetical protein BU16DRAFT_620278 [Lophium mytilinum]
MQAPTEQIPMHFVQRLPAYPTSNVARQCFVHHPTCIESFQQGYPRLSAFMNSDRDFVTFRYFGRLHARILLQKQDEIIELEERLDELDRNEATAHFHRSRRHDRNTIRQDILREAERKLEDYNKLLHSYYEHIERPKPERMKTQSVCNWMNGNKPLIQPESTFLNDFDDLSTPNERTDQGGLDRVLEKYAYSLRKNGPRKQFFSALDDSSKSNDRHVLLLSPSRIHAVSRFLTTALAVLTLTVPIVVLYVVHAMTSRLCIISLFTALFSSALSWLTHSRNYEIFSATAAYCAVMVVFVGNIPGGPS